MAIFNLTNRTDRLRGGNNVADQFIIDAADDLQAADTISGGTGGVVDVLTISFAGTYAFNQATASAMLVGIERIDIATGATALYVGSGSTLTNAMFLRINGGKDGDVVAMVPNQATAPVTAFGFWIEGNGGADTLHGTGAADTLVGGDGADLLFGYGGDDRGDGGADGAMMDGGAGSDTLAGGAGNDELWGREGDDSMAGAGGDDVMSGGDGLDRFDGGQGSDTFKGDGDGPDTAIGGAGDDLLELGTGGGALVAGSGNNTLRGGQGNDWAMSDGNGADRFEDAGAGDDVWLLYGATSGTWDAGSGNDFLSAPSSGRIIVLAGDGDDTLISQGADSIQGGSGNDLYGDVGPRVSVVSASSQDFFDGGAGDDTVYDGEGNDTVLGGSGNDLMTARGSFLLPDVPSMAFAGDAVFLIRDTELSPFFNMQGGHDSMDGGTGDDTMEAGLGNDTFDGGAGNDVFRPIEGADSFIGGEGDDIVEIEGVHLGADTFEGGAGIDRVIVANGGASLWGKAGIGVSGFEVLEGVGTSAYRFTLAGSDLDSVFGASGADRIDARRQATSVVLEGRGGNDTLVGGAAGDTLSGGLVNDNLSGLGGADSITGGVGADTIDGGSGDDTVEDGEGNDRILGGGGADLLHLGTGSDTVLGGAGADTVRSDLAGFDITDLLVGGDGADAFVIAAQSGDLTTALTNRASGFETIVIEHGGGSGIIRIALGDGMVDSIGVALQVELRGRAMHVDGSSITEAGFVAFGGGESTVLGGAGADTLSAGASASRLEGGDGADRLSLNAGADSIWGGAGDDVFLGAAGLFGTGDVLIGDAGFDTLRFTGVAGIALAAGSLATVSGIERIELPDESNELFLGANDLLAATGVPRILGGAEADVIDASARPGAIHLLGAGGDDILIGSDGGATLDGGTGSDMLLGGKDADRLVLGDLDAGDVVDGGRGLDTLILDIGSRRVTGGLLAGVQGIEVLEMSMLGGRVSLPAGMLTGSDGLEVRILSGAASGGSVNASALTRVTLLGGAGADSLLGGTGADTINGGAGADTIAGGRGADLLDLTAGGADTLRYGSPADSGQMSGGRSIAASDVVIGFGADDEIVLQRSGFAGLGTGGTFTIVPGPSTMLGVAVLLVDEAGGIADFRSVAALNAGFGGQLRANGRTGDSAFILTRNVEGDSAALYWLRDGNDNAIIDAGDALSLLAVFHGPTLPGADDFRLI
ncbi:MAG: calcium-binding protein [Roseomonas sp.]|nr:calcium-binding protein [Roseomonas sp.]